MLVSQVRQLIRSPPSEVANVIEINTWGNVLPHHQLAYCGNPPLVLVNDAQEPECAKAHHIEQYNYLHFGTDHTLLAHHVQ